jgi:hypothetical protein
MQPASLPSRITAANPVTNQPELVALDGAEGADADVHAEDGKPVFAAGFGRVWINALPGWRSPLRRTAR